MPVNGLNSLGHAKCHTSLKWQPSEKCHYLYVKALLIHKNKIISHKVTLACSLFSPNCVADNLNIHYSAFNVLNKI